MDFLETEIRGNVAWVWLNRPEKLNALNEALLAALDTTFRSLSTNTDVCAIVLAGRGRAFSAGFDIAWMAERTPEMAREDRVNVREVYNRIEQCPQPLISAVHGPALGGGLILALISDYVLASEQARFGAPEVKIGIFPSLGLVPRLERVIGIRAAKQILLTGEPVDSTTATQIGLATRLVPEAELYVEAQRLADQLAALPSLAVRAIKASFAAHPLPGYTSWETDRVVECWSAPERQAAMRAFLNKRQSEKKP
jgi:enoyl-CoA hydratase/carnithine racemase